jgi:hypothetical protein
MDGNQKQIMTPAEVQDYVSSLESMTLKLSDMLGRGLQLSTELRDAIPTGSAVDIRCISEKIGGVSDSIEALQFERMQIVKSLCRLAGLSEPADLPEVPDAMKALCGMLPAGLELPDMMPEKSLVADIRQVGKCCSEMMSDSLQTITCTLGLISSSGTRASLYDARGRTSSQTLAGMNVMDRRV